MSQAWPAVQFQEHSWPPFGQVLDLAWSNRRRRANRGTYQQAIAPTIADAEIRLTANLTADVQHITDDLTRFDAQYQGGAPFGAVLLRSESSASSQIEQLTANARRISLARLGDRSRPNATLIARNTRALEAALQLAERLDIDAILAMHQVLMEETDPHAGELRKEINWIGGDSPVTAMFVPPAHSMVPAALKDLVQFMKRVDIAAIVQAAIAHAQFETIHPFTDGNGRTGRALVSAILRARGTTENFTVPLSSGLLTRTQAYFGALNEYRRGNVEPIIQEFVQAARRAMSNVQVLMHDLDQLKEQILGTGHRTTKNLRAVANFCITEPAFTAHMVEQLGVSSSSAYTIINRLVDAKILRAERKIAGQSVWSVIGLTGALDDFADRAGDRATL